MRITALEEYGLRCLLRLALLPEGECTSAAKIAEQEGMSLQYTSKILHLCRKADLVESVRGTNGGFRLKVPAKEVSLLKIFQTVGGREAFASSFCDKHSGNEETCVHMSACSIRPVWQQLTGFFDSVLVKLSLADLCQSESAVASRVRATAKTEADNLTARLIKEEKHG